MTDAANPLEKSFQFLQQEAALYELWEKSGCFKLEGAKNKQAPVFNISMPPPNANGELHLGHAFGYTIMDILGRYYRLAGNRTMLLPGKDHAGIQTQVVFEKKLKAEGVDAKAQDVASLYEQCYAFCTDRAQYMRNQEKSLGLSADWSRELFTLDPRLNEIVFETFERLWNDGLVYKGSRIVNWSVFSQTAISDVEVEYKEQDGHLWYLTYPLAGGPQKGGQVMKLPSGDTYTIGAPGLVTATTRPETMLGDTALAVHPDDDRYRAFVGKKVIVPLINRTIPVIADKRVDPAYGTGVIKVTPAHDFADYDIGIDHALEVVQVIGKNGLMTEAAGAKYQGMKSAACREAVVADLKAGGELLDIAPMRHKVPIGERGKDIIEPLISEQWFIAVDKPGHSLKRDALALVRSGKIKIYPERFQVLFEQWLENLRDWNISRQLWWGHRLPVWYKRDNDKEEVYVGTKPPTGAGWEQEKDVFDTWFSSGQWAFSTMAAHEFVDLDNPKNDATFFPTHTMVMGRDILFFWACRMLLLTAYRVKDVPWKNIFFTGLIRDEHGQKMSKSKGNGVEPNEIMKKYGSDSLRLAMVMGATPGNDINFSERKVEGYSKFINKLWNAAKLIEMKVPEGNKISLAKAPAITLETNRWILSELQKVRSLVSQKMSEYDISIAADELYRYTWTVFCDWYLEMMKVLIDSGNATWANETKWTARICLEQILTMLHPFIPYVSEEIYQKLFKRDDAPLLANHDWALAIPKTDAQESEMRALMEVVSGVRSVKAVLNISHQKIRMSVSKTFSPELTMLVEALSRAGLCAASEIAEAKALKRPFSQGTVICEVDEKEKYRERLMKDIAQHRQIIQNVEQKLSGAFATQAKPDVVEKERERLAQSQAAVTQLESELGMS